MKTPEISIKRGDTLQLGCTYKDRDGVAQSLAGHDVRSQIRDASSTLMATLTVNLADQTVNPGEFALFASASDTALWRCLGRLGDCGGVCFDLLQCPLVCGRQRWRSARLRALTARAIA